MKTNAGFRMFVVVALAFALSASGCRSGIKMRNPFAKAPNAAASDAPSELDELDELTPPPENYTTNGDSRKKSADDESLVQNGDYDAPKKSGESKNKNVGTNAPTETALAAKSAPASVEIAPNDVVAPTSNQSLLANVAAAQSAAPTNENFQSPSYAQNYQDSQIHAASPNYQTSPNSGVEQNYAATSPAGDGTVSNALAANQGQVYQRQEVYPQISAQNTEFPTSNAVLDPFAANVATVATAPASSPGVGVDYSTMNVANGTNVGTGVAANQTAFAPTSTTASQPSAAASQPAYVAQNFPSAPTAPYQAAPTNAAPFPTSDGFAPVATSQTQQGVQTPAAADEYSNVYYQQQTTSGGFAPGSVGLY